MKIICYFILFNISVKILKYMALILQLHDILKLNIFYNNSKLFKPGPADQILRNNYKLLLFY